MLRLIIAELLFCSQALAGALPPPVSIKSQAGTKLLPKWNLQVPANQATNMGGIDALIETGSMNLLANPGFEGSTVTTGWTVAGSVTAAAATGGTTRLFGTQAISLTPSSVNGEIISQTIASGNAMVQATGNSINMEASAFIANSGLGPYQFCIGYSIAGTFSDISCADVTATSSNYQFVGPVYMPFVRTVSGEIPGVRLKSTSSTSAVIYMDQVYLGPQDSIGTVGQASLYGTAYQLGASNCAYAGGASSGESNYVDIGTAGSCAAAWTVDGGVTAVGVTSHQITLPSAPPGRYEVSLSAFYFSSIVQTCNFQFSDGTTAFGYNSIYSSSTAAISNGTMIGAISYATSGTRTFKVQAADTGATPCGLQNDVAGRKLIWIVKYFPTASQQVVGAAQTDYGPITYTPVITTVSGTMTNYTATAKQWRIGRRLYVDGNITFSGAAGTWSSIRIAIPSGLTIDTAAISGTVWNNLGISSALDNGVLGYGQGEVIYQSSTTVGPLLSVVTTHAGNGWVIANEYTQAAPFSFGSGDIISFSFDVPISGWTDNGRAPQLINSVVSNSNGVERFERASLSNGGSCAIVSQSGSWISSVADPGTGQCTMNLTAGHFSAAPTCVAVATGSPVIGIQVSASSTSAVTTRTFATNSGADTDTAFNILCMGPR